MWLECTTTIAAAQVLFALIDARMRPGEEFHITGQRLPEPPIRFTRSVRLPAHVARQLQVIPDAIIAGTRAA